MPSTVSCLGQVTSAMVCMCYGRKRVHLPPQHHLNPCDIVSEDLICSLGSFWLLHPLHVGIPWLPTANILAGDESAQIWTPECCSKSNMRECTALFLTFWMLASANGSFLLSSSKSPHWFTDLSQSNLEVGSNWTVESALRRALGQITSRAPFQPKIHLFFAS